MKKSLTANNGLKGIRANEILPEYGFSKSIPNKYASKYVAGSAVIVLDPDVAAAFPNALEANAALRAIAGIIQNRDSQRTPSRQLPRTKS